MISLKLNLLSILLFYYVKADYKIGVGISDCTGPSVEITFMGYAKFLQEGCGIQTRQYSRAFIIDDGQKRICYVTVDTAMISLALHNEILTRLNSLYNDTYSVDNVIISGTHTHSTPGGFMKHVLYDISIMGFSNETFTALADGITQSIINAHENMVNGRIFLTTGQLLDANINRSPASYLYNPEEERAKYEYDVDKEMVQVKFVRSSDNQPIGAINWFAVHPTSMNNTNCLISSDNVGLASILFEKNINNGALPGKGEFVGAIASTNLGDVSPNTKGPICINTGEPCDFIHSTCNGDAQTCIAFGPGDTMSESTEIIANKLYNKALELFVAENSYEITGPIKYIYQYVNMPDEKLNVTFPNGTRGEIQGCKPALGYSFAAGTTDGPGDFDFTQGTLTSNPFWNLVRDALSTPSQEQSACHHPKPILLNVGEVSFPYPWVPDIVSTQILLVGDLALIAVPGEFTTMSGRRLRDTVKNTIIENGGTKNVTPIITGLSNIYSSYIATPEEYQLQRYEGASTIYGPYTLSIYLNKYRQLAKALVKDEHLDLGPIPPQFPSHLYTLITPVLYDSPGKGKNFGDCVQQPPNNATIGETVTVKFVAGNPRNNVLHAESFLYVEKLVKDNWATIATDSCWETRFTWKRTNFALGESEVVIEWDIEENTEPGVYRIRHIGYHKHLTGKLEFYEGVTDQFYVQK